MDSERECWCKQKEGSVVWSGEFPLGSSQKFNLIKCHTCGTIRTESFNDSYNDQDNFYCYQSLDHRNLMAAKFILSYISFGMVIDVGCNTGLLLEYLKTKGINGVGYDPNRSAIERGSKAVDLNVGTLDDAFKKYGQVFDGVIFNHSLEHMANPVRELMLGSAILKSNGFIFIFVPNIDSLRAKFNMSTWAPLEPRYHIWHFNPVSLRCMIDSVSGLRIFFIKTDDIHGDPICNNIKTFSKKLFRKISICFGKGEQICCAVKKG